MKTESCKMKSCKTCQSRPVWKFTNQRELCASCFSRYFEKKVKSTIRKYRLPIHPIRGDNLKFRVINNVIKDLPERKGRITCESLDDISNSVVYEMMYGNGNLKKFLNKNQPLYFLSEKEILLYAKIKKIRGKLKSAKGKLKEIDCFIKEIEKKNPDIRHNIVMAVLSCHGEK